LLPVSERYRAGLLDESISSRDHRSVATDLPKDILAATVEKSLPGEEEGVRASCRDALEAARWEADPGRDVAVQINRVAELEPVILAAPVGLASSGEEERVVRPC